MIPIRDSSEGASFAVRVHPRARKTAITGIVGDGPDAALKVALSAPPVDGRANEALIEFLSALLHVPKAEVSILSGAQSRTKVVRIAGRSSRDVSALLQPHLP